LSAEELARRARAGSSDAFGELVDRYAPRVLRYLRQRVRGDHDAEDLRQETFVRVYENLHRYDPSRPFSAWLFTIAARLAVSHLRASRPNAGAEPLAYVADGERPDNIAAERERCEAIWPLAQQVLSEKQHRALRLRYADDLPIKAVAKQMGLTKTHVKVLLHRARKRLLAAETGRDAAGSEVR
jgi:RNA polymerase sigma-70 factor (ECF subfamily)